MSFTSKIGGGRGGSGSKGLGTGKKLNKEQRKKYANKKHYQYTAKTLGKAASIGAAGSGSAVFLLGTKAGKKIKEKIKKFDDYLKGNKDSENIDSPTGAKTVFQNKKNKK